MGIAGLNDSLTSCARRLVVDPEQPHAALDGLPGVLDVTIEANELRQQLV